MDLGIEKKVALVLGAGGGLGSAIAEALAREGAIVVGGGIRDESLQRTAARLKDARGRFLPLVWDLANQSLIDEKFAWIEQNVGAVDILVNNTGGPPPSEARNVPSATWSAQFESMALSVFKITDRALPHMIDKKWGRIITSTSSGVVAPIPNLGVSNTLRAALVAWSKTLAREVAPHGITSNIILPGRIATVRIRALDEAKAKREGKSVEDVVAQSVETIPMNRYGDPAEYGDVAAFLAGNRASYVTGTVVRVDGGYIPSI
ncbi:MULTISPECIES: SDR family oxidoreductase [unclassified Beijerinckia]|uniref:SDR family oxidoreductase n=1 Tax=unclassified Beijerinckia TaxID=2638183 RepID=UPI000898ECDF|nr:MULTISPECIES: SDR family oxidoreductase [unclassified Beijerinckia]MDH7799128.1 3-oxoacyl-[acyl-carrier protein] reductase [Beijerinckia sp. GAS462]SED94198.1 3-oxoacyl-[acyl-carrier protein] reductase [Beijerinckia sp. 28-YEA-48]